MIPRLFRPILEWEKNSRLSLSLLCGDAALAAWLLFAQRAFLDDSRPTSHTLAKFSVGVAVAAWIVRLHAFPGGKIRWLFAKTAALVPMIALLAIQLHSEIRAACWLAVTLAFLVGSFRVAFFAARSRWPDQPLEILRWGLLSGAVIALTLPFYRAVSFGSGDAYWYTIMLADFTKQVHAGIFPVWVGQSEFAFNGAISPLRLAPWFQHAGGLLDVMTAHALEPVALKNATLAINAFAIVFSTYGCLRVVLARRPGIACVLAALWLASPSVLAPLIMSDLIMTFMAMPFLPVVLLGCWLVWTADNLRARLVLAVGLGGAWLSHTPVALWATFLAIGICAAKFFLRREWREDLRRGALTSGMFVVLGSFPLLSVLAIDNQNSVKPVSAVAGEEVARCFPANFLPINTAPGADPLFVIQVGYAALGGFALALLLMGFARPRGALLFSAAIAGIALLVLPVPWFNAAFWSRMPSWFVAINNVWPMQRLFGLWSLLMFFMLAIVLGDERLSRRTWLTSTCLVMLLGAGAWSWHEAQKLRAHVVATTASRATTEMAMAPQNVVLTRYAYTSFSAAPAYFTHGYTDPVLENRLLDRLTLTEFVSNTEHAAPAVRLPVAADAVPRLVQSGVFTAVNQYRDVFILEPSLRLVPNVRHALRFEFLRLGQGSMLPGLLQVIDRGMFRQYGLPDSGSGVALMGPPRGFGLLPTSGRIISLQTSGSQPADVALTFVGSGSIDSNTPPSERFAFARYWLYTYTPDDLPIVVESWLPYRARLEAARPAWLETPRMWLRDYRATVNDQPAEIRRSPQNLVMVAVETGRNEVGLKYVAPWWLATMFWICIASWLALLGAGIRCTLAQARAFVTPAPA
jgi:hypothetical protein